ncbi:MAG: fucose isomerase [Candidatus Latescibacter sp.]|nr:fucose isomerase [Candidatus Latescibacter sp.]
MKNIPKVKTGIVAVSRDCFPAELSRSRKNRVIEECLARNIPVIGCDTLVENERDVLAALDEIEQKGINALVVYLGNFGPEGPLSLLADKFGGPVMLAAAAEESGKDLFGGRGDAFCGMLNASYNCDLRYLSPYIPEYPAGTPSEVAEMISEFIPVARVLLGISSLKIFSFGPRPQDFLACNAPIKPLYDLGIEIMENSELDLYDRFLQAENDPGIADTAREMAKELGEGNAYPDLLRKLAQFERALIAFAEDNLGASQFGIFANKCWPSFEKYFGFVPCYVNSRLANSGIPVSCEVDIYGALSEYMVCAASGITATLLDINNTVPYDMIDAAGDRMKGYSSTDLFMGFHCGNSPASCMADFSLKYQLIMHRLMEPGSPPNITRGTLEGSLRPGDITLFRLQSSADTQLRSYAAQGEILDINPRSFGGIGIFAVKEMGRFYRHILIGKQFPHHTAVGFAHAGKTLFSAVKMLGIDDVSFNQPRGMYYEGENPFAP